MLKREQWHDLARKLDWDYKYVREEEVFPEAISGRPWLPHSEWKDWDEAYRTTFREYVDNQKDKDIAVYAVRDLLGRVEDAQRLNTQWLNGVKMHAAAIPLIEFAAVVGELRGARFGRDSAWRTMATFGALDEYRHTNIPLLLLHELVRWDPQFDWAHRFYHSNDWVAIAARHFFDDSFLTSTAIEFALATNFVIETGFTNLQFVALSTVADNSNDHLFEKMITSIQTDEARHAQIGHPVLATVVKHDREWAQYVLDKWFWRNWLLFSILTGISMDYMTPLEARPYSFKEFMEEWIIDQYVRMLEEFGLKKPWYWDYFVDCMDLYHHLVYISAYTYRATTWFNFVVPSPEERKWLRQKYPKYWDYLDAAWDQVTEAVRKAGPGNEMAAHGTTMVTFCDLCQLVLCNYHGGNPPMNSASTLVYNGNKYVFCSPPCRWIFESEPERYSAHKEVIKRILAGEAPADLVKLLIEYFNLTPETWGKDMYGLNYPWMQAAPTAAS